MNISKRLKYIYVFFLLTFTVYSCDRLRVYDSFKDIKYGIWNKTDKIKLDVEIYDTVSYHKVFINVRNSGTYRFSNLYIFLTTIFPNGKFSRDTVNCTLANDKGKWLGNGFGDLKDCRMLLKKGVRFRQLGIYTFEFEQAMRVDKLEGIESVGLRIEKME